MNRPVESPRYAHARLGSLVLFLGVLLVVLCGMESMSDTGLTWMPRFWHTNRQLWWLLGATALASGSMLLAPRNCDTCGWRPTRAGIRFRRVELYTRAGCHLCVDAANVLERHQRWLPRTVLIDVDADARLRQKYGACVPVVVCDGKTRFKGRVPVALLRRLIEGTPPL